MPKFKFFLIANIILSAVVGGFLYFRGTEQEAILGALTTLIAFTPINFALSEALIFKRAARLIEKLGVGMRSTAALDRLSTIDTAAFSMNKMLTTGEYFITDLIPEGLTQAGLLSTAASAERGSKHPLGRKIFETAEARELKIDNATMFNEFDGNGVEALIKGNTIRVGRASWIKGEGVKISMELRTKIDQIAARSKTPLVVSIGRTARGLIGLKDELDERAPIFLERLKYNGLETVLLTAEPKKKAQTMIKNLSVDVLRAELLPEDKAREIQLMQARGRVVLMISSDVKDLPAFEAADVSVLIADGESEAADFVITDAGQFFDLLPIASRVKKILRLNRRIALGIWVLMSPLLAEMLVDIGAVPMPPLLATIGVLFGAGLIVWNSSRMTFSKEE